MKKWLMIVGLILVLVMAIAGVGYAATKYADVTGTWTGTGYYAESAAQFYSDWDLILNISNQDPNGNFYGTLSFDGSDNPISGTIATNKEIMMGITGNDGRVISIKGKLSGKKISASVQVFRPVGPTTDTGKFVLTKQP
jgi:hypothetical protein